MIVCRHIGNRASERQTGNRETGPAWCLLTSLLTVGSLLSRCRLAERVAIINNAMWRRHHVARAACPDESGSPRREAVKHPCKNISRKGAKPQRRKKSKAFILCDPCVLASLREIVFLSRLPWRGEDAPRRGWKYLLIMSRPRPVLPFIFGSF